jgi:hypothetical protein
VIYLQGIAVIQVSIPVFMRESIKVLCAKGEPVVGHPVESKKSGVCRIFTA